MNGIDILLGQSIARHRKRNGMSQQQLAGKLGLSPQSIDSFERGVRRASAKQLFEMSDVLNVRIEGLFAPEDDRFAAHEPDPALPSGAQEVVGHYEALSSSHRSAIFAFLSTLKDDEELRG